MMKTDNRVDIGKRIKELRIESGLSQEKLATMTGMSRGSFSDIERGKRGFSIDVLHKIIVALDVTYVEFFKGIDGAESLLRDSETKRNKGSR